MNGKVRTSQKICYLLSALTQQFEVNKLLQHLFHSFKMLFTKGSFVQNATLMSTSSLLNILLQFLFFPILSRIYDPAAYGAFALFNSLVIIVSTGITLSYHRALVLPREEAEFRSLLRLCIRTSLLLSAVVFVLSFFLADVLRSAFELELVHYWIYAIAPLALIFAWDQIIVQWSVRQKAFRKFAQVEVPIVLSSKLFNVGFGKLVSAGPDGLIIANLMIFFGRIVFFLKYVLQGSKADLFASVSRAELKESRQQYRAYPRFVMPSQFLNMLSNYFPALLLPFFFGRPDEAGYLSYALIVLDLPVRLLDSGLSAVFLQKATSLWDTARDQLRVQTEKLFFGVMVMALPVLIITAAFGREIYTFVFSGQWTMAGQVAEILVMYYFLRYLGVPFTALFQVAKKEKGLLVFQVVLFVVRVASLLITGLMEMHFLQMILWYSVANALAHFFYNLWIFKIAGLSVFKCFLAMLAALVFAWGAVFELGVWVG